MIKSHLPNNNNYAYPTKQEILDNIFTPPKDIIDYIIKWKNNDWNKIINRRKVIKFVALKNLATGLAKKLGKPVIVNMDWEAYSCYYNNLSQTIYINKTVSIISTLHELGHHLFGPSELKACIWSVSLFKATFPKAYKKLEWKGHLLIKSQS